MLSVDDNLTGRLDNRSSSNIVNAGSLVDNLALTAGRDRSEPFQSAATVKDQGGVDLEGKLDLVGLEDFFKGADVERVALLAEHGGVLKIGKEGEVVNTRGGPSGASENEVCSRSAASRIPGGAPRRA